MELFQSLITNKIIAAIAYPILIALAVACGILWLQNQSLQHDKATLISALEQCKVAVKATEFQLRAAEEQTRVMKDYYQNRPAPLPDNGQEVDPAFLEQLFKIGPRPVRKIK